MGRRRQKSDARYIYTHICHTQKFYGKQSKSFEKEQQQEQRRFWSKWKRIEENLQMKKSTSKQTRLFQAKLFPRNGATGQIEQSSYGKSLGKEVRWAMKIESRRGTAECGRQLDEDEQKRRCASARIVNLETNQQTKTTNQCKLWPEYGNSSTAWYMDGWGEFQKDLNQGDEKKGRNRVNVFSMANDGR